MHSPSHRVQSCSLDSTQCQVGLLAYLTAPLLIPRKFIFSASISHITKARIPNSMSYPISGACTFAPAVCFSGNVLFFSCSIFLQMKFKLCFKPLHTPSVFEKTSLRGLLYTYFPKSLIFLCSGLFLYPVHFYFCFSFSILQLLTSVSFLSESEFPQARTKLPPLHPLSV